MSGETILRRAMVRRRDVSLRNAFVVESRLRLPGVCSPEVSYSRPDDLMHFTLLPT